MKLKNLRDLVHATVKDLTYIGTTVNEGKDTIDININFGCIAVVIPITIRDIMMNKSSTRGFLTLIREPLEDILRSHLKTRSEEAIDVTD